MSNERAISSVGLLAATAASLCCITPIIALVAGASGAASSLSWLEPLRPYLIGVAVLTLGFAWYQSLRTKKDVACGADGVCKVEAKSFLTSKTFLFSITVVTALIVAFPYYAKVFYPRPQAQHITVADKDNIQTAIFTIKGMTCAGCEEHVNSELAKVAGVKQFVTSYEKRNSVVQFDRAKANVEQLSNAIAKTGYKVVATKIEPHGNTD